MAVVSLISGFSKLSESEKAQVIATLTSNPEIFLLDIASHQHPVTVLQKAYSEFSENTLTNFFLPFSIAPNFLINDKLFHIPMVTEESSVVAAASSAAKFWSDHGGFKCRINGTLKKGQVHFLWTGDPVVLNAIFKDQKDLLLKRIEPLTISMQKRGGGIKRVALKHLPTVLEHYYQLDVEFETSDAMGANFINSVLESLALEWQKLLEVNENQPSYERSCQIIMSILSNYTPDCLVECVVKCDYNKFNGMVEGMTGEVFAMKFRNAMQIAAGSVERAVTHNKGIMNGVDAVVVATGNDFRAVEANAHAYASKNGQYTSLSELQIADRIFTLKLTMPLVIGTIGGLTTLHPMAKHALDILGNPSAESLMMIAASAGLANNFSAVRSLITTGIQAGHMKMHLSNILAHLNATEDERKKAAYYFSNKKISYTAVKEFLQIERNRTSE